jgi:SAM-dependent MidA family methyltransferase
MAGDNPGMTKPESLSTGPVPDPAARPAEAASAAGRADRAPGAEPPPGAPSAQRPAAPPPPDARQEALHRRIADAIADADGWIGFDRFMALALYAPGLGYYARDSAKFGALPQSGSDFVTAPELSPLFGRALAAQVAEALAATGTAEVWEFGAGSGALAAQLLEALDAAGARIDRYAIVEVSAHLRARQRERLAAWGDKVRWLDALPERIAAVVVGNEVLDAMPVQLLARHGGAADGAWHERGVALDGGRFAWADRPTGLRPPVAIDGPQDYLTEIHPQGRAFVRTLGDRLERGTAFLLDYGFPEAEYYHPQRHMGTVMCHRAHVADDDPLADAGAKDITAHVDFTGVALAAQEAGLEVLGYTSQAHFLYNCGIGPMLDAAPLAERAMAARLVHEHEMGELFKVIALGRGPAWAPMGFARGDRTHRL